MYREVFPLALVALEDLYNFNIEKYKIKNKVEK